MKWLLCILLSASVLFIGVDGESNDNCTYVECAQLLTSLNEATPLSTDYCMKYSLTADCISINLAQCGGLNEDIGIALATELGLKPGCTGNVTTPTPVDCTYAECATLFNGLNTTGTSYCTKLKGVYNCLNRTSSMCPRDDINALTHDAIKMGLDSLQPNCTCPPCQDAYNATIAVTPDDANYCELHAEVDRCIKKVIRVCSHDDGLFWETYFLSLKFGELPTCNKTTGPVPNGVDTGCLNGTANEHVHVELNDDLPHFIDNSKLNPECATNYIGSFYYCGMYSYSHLRSFNSNQVSTCSLPGLWAMFNHPSLRVTVLNAVTNMHGPYTVVDEVTILVPASDCSQEATYHASVTMDHLPSTFEDGTSGVNGLESIFNSNATSVYIRIPWINTIVAVHKLAAHIGIVIQSPESVANQSVGLCSLGCPEHSQVTIEEIVHGNPSGNCTQGAYLACSINDFAIFKLTTEEEHYYEKCIFDVLQTNYSNSAWVTLAMVNSWYLLGTDNSSDPSQIDIPVYENQQTDTESDTSSAANSPNASESMLYTVLLTFCLSLYTTLYVLPS